MMRGEVPGRVDNAPVETAGHRGAVSASAGIWQPGIRTSLISGEFCSVQYMYKLNNITKDYT